MKSLLKILLLLVALAGMGLMLLGLLAAAACVGWMPMRVMSGSWLSAMVGPLLFFGVVFVILLCGFLVSKALGGALGSRDEAPGEEETRMVQELHRGLSGLEQRIEALETILLDRGRRHTPKGGGADGAGGWSAEGDRT